MLEFGICEVYTSSLRLFRRKQPARRGNILPPGGSQGGHNPLVFQCLLEVQDGPVVGTFQLYTRNWMKADEIDPAPDLIE